MIYRTWYTLVTCVVCVVLATLTRSPKPHLQRADTSKKPRVPKILVFGFFHIILSYRPARYWMATRFKSCLSDLSLVVPDSEASHSSPRPLERVLTLQFAKRATLTGVLWPMSSNWHIGLKNPPSSIRFCQKHVSSCVGEGGNCEWGCESRFMSFRQISVLLRKLSTSIVTGPVSVVLG